MSANFYKNNNMFYFCNGGKGAGKSCMQQLDWFPAPMYTWQQQTIKQIKCKHTNTLVLPLLKMNTVNDSTRRHTHKHINILSSDDIIIQGLVFRHKRSL